MNKIELLVKNIIYVHETQLTSLIWLMTNLTVVDETIDVRVV